MKTAYIVLWTSQKRQPFSQKSKPVLDFLEKKKNISKRKKEIEFLRKPVYTVAILFIQDVITLYKYN
jgi:hypothetical protein